MTALRDAEHPILQKIKAKVDITTFVLYMQVNNASGCLYR